MTIITTYVSCCLSHSLLLTAKNFFRVSYRTGGQLQSHCFQASDAFNKQQWINCIRQAKEAAALTEDQPPETGQCLETGLSGQMGPLGETGLSVRYDSGLEDEKRMWGDMETGLGLEGEVGLSGEKDLGLGGEAGVGLTRETMMGREMETGLGVDGRMGSKLDGETGIGGETRLTISETETGEMETGKGGGGDMGAEPGARADWKMDDGGGGGGEGETLGGGANDAPTSLLSSASPCEEEEEEREVMEEERSGTEEGEEVGMDTSEVDSLQCEELTLRC